MEKLAAFNTMTAIKKKMHNMKQDKENAFDKADQLDQKLIEHRAISERVDTQYIGLVSVRVKLFRTWHCTVYGVLYTQLNISMC